MSTIIMDLCSYTRLGLTGYLLSRGVKKREINDIETVDDLAHQVRALGTPPRARSACLNFRLARFPALR